LTEEVIAKIVQKRLLEHQIADRRNVSPLLRGGSEQNEVKAKGSGKS